MRHFKPSEFPGYEKMSLEILSLIDDIRDRSGHPIRINSAWRGSGGGYHPIGLALDFCWPGGQIDALEQYCVLREFREIGGLGFYPDWHTPGWHIDLRGGFVQWVRIGGEGYLYGAQYVARALRMIVKSG